MDTVLVTGGKGFLGKHIVSTLTKLGYTVRVFARSHGDKGPGKDFDSNVFWGDIRDQEKVNLAVDGVDKVIHLVSNFRKGGSDKKEAYAINVEGTENVLKACLTYNVKKLVHCSTIGVHGNVREIPADENTAFNPGDLYQKTKLIAEKRVWKFYKETGLPIAVVRPISMFGPGDLRMLKLFRMINKGRFIIIGKGNALFQPAYIDDVVRGFMLCLNNDRSTGEAFIMGGEEYVPLKELFHLIAKELGAKPPKLKIPMFPASLLAILCEKMCAPFNIEPPLHRRRLSFFKNNRAFTIEKAKRILGYLPEISLREGIKKTAGWYKEQGLI